MKELMDAELMELVRVGDFSAFDELYNRYHKPIYNFLFSLTWDPETAEDYLQEVFLRLYQARERYQPTGKFSTFIFQIAKNYYLSQRRKTQLEEVSIETENRDGYRPYENIRASERVEPEIYLLEGYRRFKIRQAIDTLPDAQKLVFVMAHFEDMSYAEISEVLGIPVGTVKSKMFSAVSRLRALLGEDI